LFAHHTLAAEKTAFVIGATSRGQFMRSPEKRVIFLSFEPWRGPLTVNLAERHPQLDAITTGDAVQLTPDTIVLPSVDILIDLRHTPIWTAAPAPMSALTENQRRALLAEVTKLIAARAGNGPGAILLYLLGLAEKTDLSAEQGTLLVYASGLRTALVSRQVSRVTDAASRLLGYGRGLTPSGDDLLTGFLLALNRWTQYPYSRDQLHQINTRLVNIAYTQTTSLSANLIAAAAQGQADERLVTALDALLTAALPPTEIAHRLLSYGSSSGIDALLGMALVLQPALPAFRDDPG
jgi:hypothetical protein